MIIILRATNFHLMFIEVKASLSLFHYTIFDKSSFFKRVPHDWFSLQKLIVTIQLEIKH